jgi:mono/diheme cytochrome c family protein
VDTGRSIPCRQVYLLSIGHALFLRPPLTTARQILRLRWITGASVALAVACLANASSTEETLPTYSKDIAPILFKHCVSCHQTGEIASAIPLDSYAATRPRAQSIKEAVVHGQMPPWPADPQRSLKFRNDPRLSDREINTLVAWVTAGAPKGNDADLPPAPAPKEGWLHPQGIPPDLVITLPVFHIPASGEIPYVKYLAKIPISEDKWIVAMQVLPGNRALVHHMAITEVALNEGIPPDEVDTIARIGREMGLPDGLIKTHPAIADPVNPAVYDMLGVYTPGTTFEMYPDNSAKLLKSGKNIFLNCNIHYQTTGQPETDQSRIAFWFRSGPPQHQIYRVPAAGQTIIANGKELLTDSPGEKAEGTNVAFPPIPPFAGDYEVIGITAYTDPVTIYQLQPHAHLRGKDFKYVVVFPDGREETVLTVPKYEFHWQLAYDLDEPLKMPAGSKLIVTAHYDNSPANSSLAHHHNHGGDPAQQPGPDKEVYFREANQSWDEMFTPFIQYSVDSNTNDSQPATASTSAPLDNLQVDNLKIVEAVGCLEERPSRVWMLTQAGPPSVSETQSTSAATVAMATEKPAGSLQYRLLGSEVFSPLLHQGQKVAIKGVLLEDSQDRRVNVTSLQTVAATCP